MNREKVKSLSEPFLSWYASSPRAGTTQGISGPVL